MKTREDKGFTIIEVLIVLAIAGLIMLIVFLAVPALQRNTRNARRRSDLARFYTSVREYQTNRNKMSSSPFTGSNRESEFDNFKENFIGEDFKIYKELSDGIESYEEGHSHVFQLEPDQIRFFPWHYCADGNTYEGADIETVSAPGNAHTERHAYSVLIGMEGGFSYCIDTGVK